MRADFHTNDETAARRYEELRSADELERLDDRPTKREINAEEAGA